MLQHSKPATKYLLAYAEPEAVNLTSPDLYFDRCVVIPAFAETTNFLQPFMSSFFDNVLVIVVLNTPDRELSLTEKKTTEKFLEFVKRQPIRADLNTAQLYFLGRSNALLCINRTYQTQPIPRHEGVGLARKIGCDCAVRLIKEGVVRSPIIHSTDADAKLPRDYFQLASDSQGKLLVYRFIHELNENDKNYEAAKIYDFSLHYYVEGLRYAGSPYAFHTIGSLLAFHAEIYCQVRGFTKRSGGEDFYFLNKAAKLTPVVSIPATVALSSRPSTRVPFGTGPGILKIAELEKANEEPLFYHPHAFRLLRCFLQVSCRDNRPINLDAMLNSALGTDQEILLTILKKLKFSHFLEHCESQQLTTQQYQKQFLIWFDAFKTMKFIHHAHELNLAKQNIEFISTSFMHANLSDCANYQSLREHA